MAGQELVGHGHGRGREARVTTGPFGDVADRQRLFDVSTVCGVVVVAAEIAHRPVAEVPPAVPTAAREASRGTAAPVPVPATRSKWLVVGIGIASESVDDLDAVVEPVRLVELPGGRRILDPPRAVRPDVDFARGPMTPVMRSSLIVRRAGEAWPWLPICVELRVSFAAVSPNEPGFPDVVGERLLAVDVLAVRQRQVSGERMRVLGRGDHDGVEVVRAVERAGGR
jgi:hypothetical protein